MEIKRCGWCEKDELYREYHDKEWGKPLYDDVEIFEFLILESFQAGLSWHTILKKRDGFKKAFDAFDFEKIAKYDNKKIEELMQNTEIVRNRLKIRAAVTNAQKFIEVRKEFGTFSKFIWSFVDGKPIVNYPETLKDIPTTTPLSDKIAKELKQRGFKFLGSIVIYSHMEATGMINNHLKSCSFK